MTKGWVVHQRPVPLFGNDDDDDAIGLRCLEEVLRLRSCRARVWRTAVPAVAPVYCLSVSAHESDFKLLHVGKSLVIDMGDMPMCMYAVVDKSHRSVASGFSLRR